MTRTYFPSTPVPRDALSNRLDGLSEDERMLLIHQADHLSRQVKTLGRMGALEILFQIGTLANRDKLVGHYLTHKLAGDETLAGELDALRAG